LRPKISLLLSEARTLAGNAVGIFLNLGLTKIHFLLNFKIEIMEWRSAKAYFAFYFAFASLGKRGESFVILKKRKK